MTFQARGFILSVIAAGLMLPAAAQTTDATPAAKPATINQRQRNQQRRIAQGVKSGQLTAAETAHLERREAAIHQEVHNERTANGGKLTPAERRQVTRQQNRTSRAIYRKKHNDRVQ
jgi:hypothetical protein